ncbi:MAG: hypothetical protein GWP17_05930, partial [Aquificales bacterium]|nr:hypothetical protein [Aquificales bacterium]
MPETTVTLSREELLAILTITKLGSVLGLVPEPIEGISVEQEAYGQICAERTLRARGLAHITSENQLAIHKDLLSLVIACARATQTIVISQTAVRSGQTRRLYLHLHQNEWVVHAKPDPVIHALSRHQDKEGLASLMMAFCGWADRQSDHQETRPLQLHAEVLKQIQTQLQNESTDAAIHALDGMADAVNARQLVRHLANPRVVTIIQQIEAADEDSFALHSWTISDDGTELWRFIDNKQDSNLIDIQTVSYQTVLSLFQ